MEELMKCHCISKIFSDVFIYKFCWYAHTLIFGFYSVMVVLLGADLVLKNEASTMAYFITLGVVVLYSYFLLYIKKIIWENVNKKTMNWFVYFSISLIFALVFFIYWSNSSHVGGQ